MSGPLEPQHASAPDWPTLLERACRGEGLRRCTNRSVDVARGVVAGYEALPRFADGPADPETWLLAAARHGVLDDRPNATTTADTALVGRAHGYPFRCRRPVADAALRAIRPRPADPVHSPAVHRRRRPLHRHRDRRADDPGRRQHRPHQYRPRRPLILSRMSAERVREFPRSSARLGPLIGPGAGDLDDVAGRLSRPAVVQRASRACGRRRGGVACGPASPPPPAARPR
jgi:hypothetical protein